MPDPDIIDLINHPLKLADRAPTRKRVLKKILDYVMTIIRGVAAWQVRGGIFATCVPGCLVRGFGAPLGRQVCDSDRQDDADWRHPVYRDGRLTV